MKNEQPAWQLWIGLAVALAAILIYDLTRDWQSEQQCAVQGLSVTCGSVL